MDWEQMCYQLADILEKYDVADDVVYVYTKLELETDLQKIKNILEPELPMQQVCRNITVLQERGNLHPHDLADVAIEALEIIEAYRN